MPFGITEAIAKFFVAFAAICVLIILLVIAASWFYVKENTTDAEHTQIHQLDSTQINFDSTIINYDSLEIIRYE